MRKTKFKKGAASFYVIAFSTLILLIIVASFTALVIAQITRSSNADLSQSAYDSALAGVEDAKLAFYNYQNCLAQGAEAKVPDDDGTLNCNEIVYIMENTSSCDMVSYVLGRAPYDPTNESGSEVMIEESNTSGNNMSQAYTCTKVEMSLKDYRASLSAANQMKITRVKFDDIPANNIKKMKISWGVNSDETQAQYSNFAKDADNNSIVRFPSAENFADVANPPVVAVALLQAAETFSLEQFKMVGDGATNRGMVFLVPTNSKDIAKTSKAGNYHGGFDNEKNANFINKNALVESNNQQATNLPYVVYCDSSETSDSEFMCNAMIELPAPIGNNDGGTGVRGNDNFIVAVSLPYGKPDTDISLEFFCDDGATCGASATGVETSQANLKGVQVGIDSTGRANDLFRRVETRLEAKSEGGLLSIMGPLELFGDNSGNGSGGSDALFTKNYAVTCEYDFEPTCWR